MSPYTRKNLIGEYIFQDSNQRSLSLSLNFVFFFIRHCSDDGEETLHEKHALVDSEADASPPKRKHKDRKSHHKKHNHRKKNHKGPPPESFLEESLAVSDTSNKENTCLNHVVSEAEETVVTTEATKPKVSLLPTALPYACSREM